MPESSLYERLGGVFAIAAVVDRFSDALVQNPIVGRQSKNPALRAVAHQQSWQTAGSEVHAHTLGMRCGRRPLPLLSDPPGPHLPGPGRAHRRPADQTRGVRCSSRPNLRATLDAFNVPEPGEAGGPWRVRCAHNKR